MRIADFYLQNEVHLTNTRLSKNNPVKFYERLGFKVLLEEKIGSRHWAYTNWTMRKDL